MKEFFAGCNACKATKSSAQSVEPVTSKRVLIRFDTDHREDKLEKKLDPIVVQSRTATTPWR